MRKIALLTACAFLATAVTIGCSSKTARVDETPGDKPAVETPAQPTSPTPPTPPTPPTQPAEQKPAVVEEKSTGDTVAAPAAPATPPASKKEEVVTPAAPAVKVELLKKIYFDYDKSAIRADAKDQLDKNYDYLSKNANVKVQIVGHCDERGTSEYNMALGDRRANSAKSYLATRGIAKGRLDTLSKGKEEPEDPGHDEAAWAKNRRAEFLAK